MKPLRISFLVGICLLLFHPGVYARETLWDFQSIDTMKYSRDLSREKLQDPTFIPFIDEQVHAIASTGATHVAIATPYDEEFVPILTIWVQSARKYNLHVWFRGNWSGWEQWFGYPAISFEEHSTKTRQFISSHPDLFVDGDVFSACPECENGNGGAVDPRKTGNVTEYRNFLITEYSAVTDSFRAIGKTNIRQFNSMNADVARLVMDKETTKSLGGLVVIDHYVSKPEQLVHDVQTIAQESGGKVVLGEFGAPIPNINSDMTETEQATWIEQVLLQLSKLPQLSGINYWVNVGGSTQLWENNKDHLIARPAVSVLTHFYLPIVISGMVTNEWGGPVAQAHITTAYRQQMTDSSGKFQIPVTTSDTISVTKTGFENQHVSLNSNRSPLAVMLKSKNPNFFYRLFTFMYQTLKNIRLLS